MKERFVLIVVVLIIGIAFLVTLKDAGLPLFGALNLLFQFGAKVVILGAVVRLVYCYLEWDLK